MDAEGETRVLKLPSSPADPGAAVAEGLARLGATPADRIVHGTTVGLNALLTGRVARTALVTNRGFRDLIEIDRQDRPDLYALEPRRAAALAPRELRFEVDQRSFPDGAGGFEQAAEPTPDDLRKLARRIGRSGAEAVAVCLLHSYADPAIERRVADALAAELDLPITCSAELLAEHREVERFHTALVNAALQPTFERYLGALEARLAERLGGPPKLSILQSSGGTLPAPSAAREPVRVVLSGPAGGVVGAAAAAEALGHDALISFDMGGTSSDVAFHSGDAAAEEGRRPGDLPRTAGLPIGVPTLDIHTIGCGGGSLLHVDAAGALRVGPSSAGADPGPVCHGRSDQLTLTDAHVALGHVGTGSFLGGEFPLDTDAVQRAFELLGRRLGAKPIEVARGAVEIARAHSRRALRVMTLERGRDPARLPLVAFGGAGGLHAAPLAQSLGLSEAIVPMHPGALSALGMTRASARRDAVRTVLEPLGSLGRGTLAGWLRDLRAEARAALRADGVPARGEQVEREADLRYAGQGHELRLTIGTGDLAKAFESAHERLFGYLLEGAAIELVCLRVRVRGALAQAAALPTPRRRAAPRSARRPDARVDLGQGFASTPIWDRAALAPGHWLDGPAVIQEYSGTTLVPPGTRANVGPGGHLRLRAGA